MVKYQKIEKYSSLAEKLKSQRMGLLEHLPHGNKFLETLYDLDHIIEPTVAVVGSFSSGKSSLINEIVGSNILPVSAIPTTQVPVQLKKGKNLRCIAKMNDGGTIEIVEYKKIEKEIIDSQSKSVYLLIESPNLLKNPIVWLDLPGTNLEETKSSVLDFTTNPSDVADICILATPATQPLSISDIQHYEHLVQKFNNPALIPVVITKTDLVNEKDLDDVKKYVLEKLAECWTGNKNEIKVITFSTKTKSTVKDLTDYVTNLTIEMQAERLKVEMRCWKSFLSNYKQLLLIGANRNLNKESIYSLGEKLKMLILKKIGKLLEDIPSELELALQSINFMIPGNRKELIGALKLQFDKQIQMRLEEIHRTAKIDFKELADTRISKDVLDKLNKLSADPTGILFHLSFDISKLLSPLGYSLCSIGTLVPIFPVIVPLFGVGILGGLLLRQKEIKSIDELRSWISNDTIARCQKSINQYSLPMISEVDRMTMVLSDVLGSTERESFLAMIDNCTTDFEESIEGPFKELSKKSKS